ncbi:MAG: tetratricopeptide repeat protein [Chloroflexota bacterium]
MVRLFLWAVGLVAVAALVACSSPTPAVPLGDPKALLAEGRLALDRQDFDLAIQKLQETSRADPQSVEAHFLLGNAYTKKDQWPEAEKSYLAALKLDANHVDARSNLGFVYYQSRKLDAAEKEFRQALALTPNDAEIHYNLGGVLAANNRYEEAVSEFRQATQLDPQLAEPYLGLGSVYSQLGRRDEAIAALRTYLGLASDPTWRAQAEQMLRTLEAQR